MAFKYKHSKADNNETARLLAYTGPIVCRVKWTRTLYARYPEYGFKDLEGNVSFESRQLKPGELVILFRGPRPSGEHKLPGGDSWLIYTLDGPMYFTDAGRFSDFFEQI